MTSKTLEVVHVRDWLCVLPSGDKVVVAAFGTAEAEQNAFADTGQKPVRILRLDKYRLNTPINQRSYDESYIRKTVSVNGKSWEIDWQYPDLLPKNMDQKLKLKIKKELKKRKEHVKEYVKPYTYTKEDGTIRHVFRR